MEGFKGKAKGNHAPALEVPPISQIHFCIAYRGMVHGGVKAGLGGSVFYQSIHRILVLPQQKTQSDQTVSAQVVDVCGGICEHVAAPSQRQHVNQASR